MLHENKSNCWRTQFEAAFKLTLVCSPVERRSNFHRFASAIENHLSWEEIACGRDFSTSFTFMRENVSATRKVLVWHLCTSAGGREGDTERHEKGIALMPFKLKDYIKMLNHFRAERMTKEAKKGILPLSPVEHGIPVSVRMLVASLVLSRSKSQRNGNEKLSNLNLILFIQFPRRKSQYDICIIVFDSVKQIRNEVTFINKEGAI